jgi:hypothetical protein
VTTEPQGCDLCGLPVPRKAYHAKTADGERTFCCEGCLGIWAMLNGEDADPAAEETDKTERRTP